MFHRFPNQIQLDTMDCGPTCLSMVAQEWTDQDWINANDAWNYYCSDFVIAEEEDAG